MDVTLLRNKLVQTFRNKKIRPRFATLVNLHDGPKELIDNGIIIHFPAPNSFTGDDVVRN